MRRRGPSEETAVEITASPNPTNLSFDHEKLKDQRECRRPISYVPPENHHRCLIICFDGTGDQFDADNSNIVQLVSALRKDDRAKQMVYYQSGIGTYSSSKLATPFLTKMSLTLDAAIAWNLDSHVMSGYEFLMQNYTTGDRICIFGFSRGAYTARSLAGMIHKVGLLPVDNHQQVPFAYKMYTRADATGWAQSNAFKKAFSNDVHIDFIGVWDTVDSVGLIPKRLPFTTSNTIVRTFRHAVSLDERRAKFKANLWNFPDDTEKVLGVQPTPSPPATPPVSELPKSKTSPRITPKHGFTLPSMSVPKMPKSFKSSGSDTDDSDEAEQTEFEAAFTKRQRKTKPTDVLEVWFAGCHCDVGGGSVPNDTRHNLARIPLRWMIRECFKADTGIMFDSRRLRELGLDPATLYPIVLPRPPPLPLTASTVIERVPKRKGWLRRMFSSRKTKEAEGVEEYAPPTPDLDDDDWEEKKGGGKVTVKEEVVQPSSSSCSGYGQLSPGVEELEDLHDSLSPIYDQLSLKPFWWILEVIPLSFRYQKRDKVWVNEVRANLGRARYIPHQRPTHESEDEVNHHSHGIEKPVVNLKVHRSVKMRREAKDAKGRSYINRARFHAEPEWVD
ncbi:hypothetical protein R3P38DRAFT_3308605 [Favolaschia claudopus]|uniref:T6SS Phospholipase effector Tle1-like catalytic domain-containing protein n=1 Tax=Favolaschia claudopus TaxID=2862362 RepID=A0AAW0D233_9AGAR